MTTTPTPRPVPTQDDRMRDASEQLGWTPGAATVNQPARTFAAYLDATERDQLDVRAATAEQERDEALDDRDAYKEARDVLRKQLDQVQQRNRDLLRQKRDTISALAAELGDAHDLIAEIRNNRANDDRAFARWETRQPALGSPPPRAQDEQAEEHTTFTVTVDPARTASAEEIETLAGTLGIPFEQWQARALLAFVGELRAGSTAARAWDPAPLRQDEPADRLDRDAAEREG